MTKHVGCVFAVIYIRLHVNIIKSTANGVSIMYWNLCASV